MKQISFHTNNLFVVKFSARAPQMNWTSALFYTNEVAGTWHIFEISDSHLNLCLLVEFK